MKLNKYTLIINGIRCQSSFLTNLASSIPSLAASKSAMPASMLVLLVRRGSGWPSTVTSSDFSLYSVPISADVWRGQCMNDAAGF